MNNNVTDSPSSVPLAVLCRRVPHPLWCGNRVPLGAGVILYIAPLLGVRCFLPRAPGTNAKASRHRSRRPRAPRTRCSAFPVRATATPAWASRARSGHGHISLAFAWSALCACPAPRVQSDRPRPGDGESAEHNKPFAVDPAIGIISATGRPRDRDERASLRLACMAGNCHPATACVRPPGRHAYTLARARGCNRSAGDLPAVVRPCRRAADTAPGRWWCAPSTASGRCRLVVAAALIRHRGDNGTGRSGQPPVGRFLCQNRAGT